MSKDDDALNDTTEARPRPRLVRSEADESTVVSDDLDIKPAFKNKWQRMLPLIGAMAVVLALGPTISRFIDAYRAVVLEVRSDKMLIQETARAPKWVSSIAAKPGDMLAKDSLTWNPTVAEPLPKDSPLIDLAVRYQLTYDGTITEVRAPNAPGRASIAVVETTDGRTIEVPLWADHLATAKTGTSLHKDPNQWDPVVVTRRP